MDIQARIPVSLAALHNFIHIHDPKEGPIIGSDSYHSTHSTDDAEEHRDNIAPVLQDGYEEINERRDQIAEAMWADYQRICQERGSNINDPFDVVDDDDDEANDLEVI
jgi:hypothetical protein